MELIPHDLIKEILVKADVKTLMKMKVVSKLWKSTIENRSFQKRQLMHRRQSRNLDVLLVSVWDYIIFPRVIEAMRTFVVGSSCSVRIFTPWENLSYNVCKSSCDGLICLYKECLSNVVCNPTTGWYREFSYSNYQLLFEEDDCFNPTLSKPGFGKDKTNDTYKVVYLYNSSELCSLGSLAKRKRKRRFVHKKKSELDGLVHDKNNATVCEVFDFTTNAWRYIVPSSSHRILPFQDPLYVDGSLYWFTEGETTLVLSFDLHTETFQVISEAPFPHRHNRSGQELLMCNLNDRLCVSEKMWPKQVIWSFDLDHKTWTEIYSIDVDRISCWFGNHKWAFTPLAVLDKDRLLFCEPKTGVPLLALNPKTKSYQVVYQTPNPCIADPLCYFQSLISF